MPEGSTVRDAEGAAARRRRQGGSVTSANGHSSSTTGQPGPQAAQPGAHVPPPSPAASPAAQPSAPPRSGTIAWALGFLAYIPIPLVNVLVTGIAQLALALLQLIYAIVGTVQANGDRPVRLPVIPFLRRPRG